MTRRAVGYARYSTDLQDERSIDDQIALIRRYCTAHDLDLAQCYSDAARSGASILGRDGLMALLDSARAGAFQVLVVEELDRLSRDIEDLAGIHKRLTFAGIDIVAVHEGVASTVTVGLRGLVGQMFREDNARKVRRGLEGRIRQGLSAGGRAYGYRPDPARRGQLVVIEDEAEVIRRIFRSFAQGDSPVQIAHRLTADGTPPPRGSKIWSPATIYGWEERRSGILRNDLYSGVLVWNKVRMLKDPDTGKRISRTNPRSAWQRAEVPEYRIIDADLWQRVQAMIEPKNEAPAVRARQKRPVRPLSGLIRCGACGSGMAVHGRDKSGRVRIQCSRHVNSRTCPAPKSWYLDTVEGAVFGLLRDELTRPDLLQLYVDTYNARRAELVAAEGQSRARIERRIATLESQIDRLVAFIADGIGDTARIGQEYADRCTELTEARASLAAEPPSLTNISLHPQALQSYRRMIATLANGQSPDGQDRAPQTLAAIRRLIDSVTVSQAADGQMSVAIEGQLWHLLHAPTPTRIRSGGALVAEEGLKGSNHPEIRYFLRRGA